METGGCSRAGKREKKGPGGLWKHVQTAQFTRPSRWKVNSYRIWGINQPVVVVIFHQLSWICKISPPEKRIAKSIRHIIFGLIHTLLPDAADTSVNAESVFILKKLYNESFINTLIIFLYNRTMMTSWLQIMTGTNLYWVSTFIVCSLSLFFSFPIFSILALLCLNFVMLTFTILTH